MKCAHNEELNQHTNTAISCGWCTLLIAAAQAGKHVAERITHSADSIVRYSYAPTTGLATITITLGHAATPQIHDAQSTSEGKHST